MTSPDLPLIIPPADSFPKYAQVEIERRWLVSGDVMALLKDAEDYRDIFDRYLHGTNMRLRRVLQQGREPVYKLGKKYAEDLGPGRPVVSIYLSEHEFNLLAGLPASACAKRRYRMAGGSLDVYEFPRHGLAVFEREFADAGAAERYRAPSFVGLEVTGTERFSGAALAGINGG
ncbi:MAG TPA: hypothetical protein VJN44_01865 [Roseateles sp.]|nr:hypothetical protein [Roseateles sp.]